MSCKSTKFWRLFWFLSQRHLNRTKIILKFQLILEGSNLKLLTVKKLKLGLTGKQSTITNNRHTLGCPLKIKNLKKLIWELRDRLSVDYEYGQIKLTAFPTTIAVIFGVDKIYISKKLFLKIDCDKHYQILI